MGLQVIPMSPFQGNHVYSRSALFCSGWLLVWDHDFYGIDGQSIDLAVAGCPTSVSMTSQEPSVSRRLILKPSSPVSQIRRLTIPQSIQPRSSPRICRPGLPRR
jgi:hypothetical protein